MQKKTAYYIVVTILVAVGLYFGLGKFGDSVKTGTVTQQSTDISYQGQEGRTALELLKEKHKVETKSFDFGEMVVGIDGRVATDNEFWAFYINGNPAQVGAGDYQTKDSDSITWKLETY